MAIVSSFACGSLTVLLTALLTALSLMLTGEAFLTVAELVVLAHVPVMVIEGVFTMFVFLFLVRVKPEMITGIYGVTKAP